MVRGMKIKSTTLRLRHPQKLYVHFKTDEQDLCRIADVKLFLSVNYKRHVYYLAIVRRFVARHTGHESLFPTLEATETFDVCIPIDKIDRQVHVEKERPISAENSPPSLLLNTDWSEMSSIIRPNLVPALEKTSAYEQLLSFLNEKKARQSDESVNERVNKRRLDGDQSLTAPQPKEVRIDIPQNSRASEAGDEDQIPSAEMQ